MANYFAFHAQFEDGMRLSDLIQPIFANEFFVPAAIGAIEAHGSGDDWFLSGYALESFLSQFPKSGQVRSIEFDQQGDVDYLERVAAVISNGVDTSGMLSPFEKRDELIGATWLESPSLSSTVLLPLAQWLSRHPNAVVYLYGSVKIALLANMRPSERSLFRFFTPGEGLYSALYPFITLRAGISPFDASAIELAIRAQSIVWLRVPGSLGGAVGLEQAERNLLQLSSLIRLLMTNPNMQARDVELFFEGRLFSDEQERIRHTLKGLL
jgi:hypothetical protein